MARNSISIRLTHVAIRFVTHAVPKNADNSHDVKTNMSSVAPETDADAYTPKADANVAKTLYSRGLVHAPNNAPSAITANVSDATSIVNAVTAL
jgi:hypothetical protein